MEGTDELNFRFTLDVRYRPELYGGNACDGAVEDEGYDCELCRGGVWDNDVKAGVHVLWSVAGRDEFVVDEDGPYPLGAAWDERKLVRTFSVPEGMLFEAGDYPVVTLMTFSQYPAYVSRIFQFGHHSFLSVFVVFVVFVVV